MALHILRIIAAGFRVEYLRDSCTEPRVWTDDKALAGDFEPYGRERAEAIAKENGGFIPREPPPPAAPAPRAVARIAKPAPPPPGPRIGPLHLHHSAPDDTDL